MKPTALMIFYPFTIALCASGFLAFIMLVLEIRTLLVSAVVLWFLFGCWAVIYALSRPALLRLGFNRLFLSLTIIAGLLATASSVLVLITGQA